MNLVYAKASMVLVLDSEMQSLRTGVVNIAAVRRRLTYFSEVPGIRQFPEPDSQPLVAATIFRSK